MGALAEKGPAPDRRRIDRPLAAGAVALACYAAFGGASSYELRLLTLAGVYALLALGYQLIFGHLGALSLAQGAFFGLGAYVTGILGSQFTWGFEATFPLSILLPLALAAVVAAPVLRLESHYFALATLGIAQVVLLLAVNWQELTGGANGLPGVPGVRLLGEPALRRGLPLLAFVWAIAGLGALLLRQLARGLLGQAWHVLRENPVAAAASGLDAGAMRFAAFLLSAAYAGAAGALYAHTLGVISPDVLEFPIMVACLTMVVVGGQGRIAGAALGALLIVHLPEWLRFLDRYYLVAYGAALLAAICIAPEGIVGALERLYARRPPALLLPPIEARRLPVGPAAGEDAATPVVLSVEGLAKSFGGVQALAGIDLAVRRGEILGLIGPNGSGKTTLLNLVTGLEQPDAGSIRVSGGIDIAGMPPHAIARRHRVARTFQSISLVDSMTALDAVAVARGAALGTAGLRTALLAPPWRSEPATLARARGEAIDLLGRLGVAADAIRPGGALPFGVRRRVEIARALALDPILLLLDEPAAGLDAAEQADLAGRLKELAADGIAIVVVEHNMPFLLPLAGRIVCLDRGAAIAEGTPEAIVRDPRVVAAYLGEPDPASSGAARS
ncbi:MAG TPA: ATP-binding cassette domain-containing protein [Stellaceae bacterium]